MNQSTKCPQYAVYDINPEDTLKSFSFNPPSNYPAFLKINGVDYEWSENPGAYIANEEKTKIEEYWLYRYHKKLNTPSWVYDEPEPQKVDMVWDAFSTEEVKEMMRRCIAQSETDKVNLKPEQKQPYFQAQLKRMEKWDIGSLQWQYFQIIGKHMKTGEESYTFEFTN